MFVPGERRTGGVPEGVCCGCVRARGEDLEGVVTGGFWDEGLGGVSFDWRLAGT